MLEKEIMCYNGYEVQITLASGEKVFGILSKIHEDNIFLVDGIKKKKIQSEEIRAISLLKS